MESCALSRGILDERDFVSHKVVARAGINEAYFIVYGYDKNTKIVFLSTRISNILYEAIMNGNTIKNTDIDGYDRYCRVCGLNSQYKYCHRCYEVIKDKVFINMNYIPLVFDSCEYISYINKEKTVYEKKILISNNTGEKIIGVLHISRDLLINFVISKINAISQYKIPLEVRVEYNLRKYMRCWLLMREFIFADLCASIVCIMIE